MRQRVRNVRFLKIAFSGVFRTRLQEFAKEMNLCSSHSKTNKPLGRETIYAMLKNIHVIDIENLFSINLIYS